MPILLPLSKTYLLLKCLESELPPPPDYGSVIKIAHPPSLVEVHTALFSIGPLKAPGVDGFHDMFFQKHWGTMWQDILCFFTECFKSKVFLVSVNDTSIFLIPKTEHPESIKQYRPISLCNTSYKIVSNLIVHHLRPLLNSIISPNQNSFLPGRGCETNYIAASEILHSMKHKKGSKGWFAMKIDLEKAYDRMEWSFIRFCLHRHGFDKESSDMIMSCVTSTSSRIRINGVLSESFQATRGLRQGTPFRRTCLSSIWNTSLLS